MPEISKMDGGHFGLAAGVYSSLQTTQANHDTTQQCLEVVQQ